MSRTGASKKFIVVCAACGHADRWEGKEDVWQVTGQEGMTPKLITVMGCECGHQQEV
jgi:hypothetical protein